MWRSGSVTLFVLLAAILIACSPGSLATASAASEAAQTSPSSTEYPVRDGGCVPTHAGMTPPAEYVQFLLAGSSNRAQTLAYLTSDNANFLGNTSLWLLLPPHGELAGLTGKFMPWRLRKGSVEWEAHRLDAAAAIARHSVSTDGYGDVGFQADAVHLPEPGCWAFTYSLNGDDALSFVLRVHL